MKPTDAWKDVQHPAGVLPQRQMPDGTWQTWFRGAFSGSIIGWWPTSRWLAEEHPIVAYADTWAEPMWPWPGDNDETG